jgi:hypothetical protein
MPTKPLKVEGAGVGFMVDGQTMSRLQSATVDTDLSVDEIRELTNSNVVEFVEGLPTVAVTFEANMWGSRKNLAYITGFDGAKQVTMVNGGTGQAEITPFVFDGTSVDIVAQIEEDGALKRSMYVGNAAVTSLGFSFDVGGVATESYGLEADNKVWYLNAQREIVVTSGYYNAGTGITLTSGVFLTPNPALTATSYFTNISFNESAGPWTPLFVTKNGEQLTDPTTGALIPLRGGQGGSDAFVVSFGYASLFGPARYRVVGFKDTANAAIAFPGTDIGATGVSAVGGIRKGMIEIYLISGSMFLAHSKITDGANKFEALRLQTCSIDVDLSREALEELGNDKAFARSLNFPISATVNFSALDSDLQLWSGLSDKMVGYQGDTVTSMGFRDFVQNHGVLIKIFDDDESNVSRAHVMTITVSGVRVASESFSVDAGGNAVQEFSCNADNFVIS